MKLPLKLFVITWMLALSAAHAAPASRTVFRCTGANELVRYQDQPCNAQELSRALQVSAIDPVLPKFAPQPVVRVPAQTQRRRAASLQASASINTTPVAAKNRRRNRKAHLVTQLPQAGCPATYQDAGVYVQGKTRWQAPGGASGKSKAPLSAIYAHYRSLPGKTYLKNQGLWPAHCPP